jgi:epoxyqueuosine reductase
MIAKEEVRAKALELGFSDVGFTTAEPFESHREILEARAESYEFLIKILDLMVGTDPKAVHPEAGSMIVLLENYFAESFPPTMEPHFGRCYQDDDRLTKDGLSRKIKALRGYLRDHGIDSRVPWNIPHRISAARAGVASFGKNNFLYANRCNGQSSWVIPVVVTVDAVFAPDRPTTEVTCPDWCRNACIAACPTHALKSPRKLDPRRCISFLTYLAREITPLDLREPMGTWIYGCDRCQNVCPRNAAWLARNLPVNPKIAAKAPDFALSRLLHMDEEYFQTRIWPHMFYVGPEKLWLWKMNVARAMGNTLNRDYVSDLVRAFGENEDVRVQGMIAWSLGRLGGETARQALERFLPASESPVREEIEQALQMM